MCELEHHVMMLQESGEPFFVSNILLNMRGVNFQIGDGSQEDAHEFLRLVNIFTRLLDPFEVQILYYIFIMLICCVFLLGF